MFAVHFQRQRIHRIFDVWRWLEANAGEPHDTKEALERAGCRGWTSEDASGDMNAAEIVYFNDRIAAIRFALEWTT